MQPHFLISPHLIRRINTSFHRVEFLVGAVSSESTRRAGERKPGMNLDDLNREAGALTRRRLMQLGAAGALSLGASRLAQAAETAVHRSMMNVPFEKREPRVAVIGTG